MFKYAVVVTKDIYPLLYQPLFAIAVNQHR